MGIYEDLVSKARLKVFLDEIKKHFPVSVNGKKPDSNGNIDVPQISATEIVNIIYPVGSLYWSSKSTDPATLFGGTWQRIKDKFILAAGDTYAAGTTGGEAKHTLTVNEMPAHRHSGSTNSTGGHTHTVGMNRGWNGTTTLGGSDISGDIATQTTNSSGSHSHTVTIANAGGGAAHNNMPPYVAYYCWERTA